MTSRVIPVSLSQQDYAWFAMLARQCGMSLSNLLASELAACAEDERVNGWAEACGYGLQVIKGGKA